MSGAARVVIEERCEFCAGQAWAAGTNPVDAFSLKKGYEAGQAAAELCLATAEWRPDHGDFQTAFRLSRRGEGRRHFFPIRPRAPRDMGGYARHPVRYSILPSQGGGLSSGGKRSAIDGAATLGLGLLLASRHAACAAGLQQRDESGLHFKPRSVRRSFARQLGHGKRGRRKGIRRNLVSAKFSSVWRARDAFTFQGPGS